MTPTRVAKGDTTSTPTGIGPAVDSWEGNGDTQLAQNLGGQHTMGSGWPQMIWAETHKEPSMHADTWTPPTSQVPRQTLKMAGEGRSSRKGCGHSGVAHSHLESQLVR